MCATGVSPVRNPNVDEMAHLYRRVGFGAGRSELEAASTAGLDATLDRLLATPDPSAQIQPPALTPPSAVVLPRRDDSEAQRLSTLRKERDRAQSELVQLVSWWIDMMVSTPSPQVEKLIFVWHDHFATGIRKVKSPCAMLRQQDTIRKHAFGPFPDLVAALSRDPAMIHWLDLDRSTAERPNENFARELMELFTLGRDNYTQDDVTEAGRAFTGWSMDRSTDTAIFRPLLHDHSSKTVLGRTGRWDGDDVVEIVTATRESARHVARTLWSSYAFPDPPASLVDTLADTYESNGRRTDALLRAIFTHPDFFGDRARNGLLKTPIEWLVGALRAFEIRLDHTGEHPQRLAGVLAQVGQLPFDPPNVGGWPQNRYWTNTAMTAGRFAAAGAVAALVAEDELPRPGVVSSMQGLFDRLGMTEVPAGFRERLSAFTGSPRDLLHVVLASPPYQRN